MCASSQSYLWSCYERLSSLRDRFSSYFYWNYGPSTTKEKAVDRDRRILRQNIDAEGASPADQVDGAKKVEEKKKEEQAKKEKEKQKKEKEKEKKEKEKELVKVIHVLSVDLHVQENAKRHHTDKFECTQRDEGGKPELVIRRGDNFLMSVTFNRPYDKVTDDLRLVFTSGNDPLPKHRNHASFLLDENKTENEGTDWSAVIKEKKGSTLTLSVHVPANCVIGEWDLSIKSFLEDKDGGKPKVFRYTYDPGLTILFNPWCPEDQVYYEETEELNEYILNDSGAVFVGQRTQISAKPWNFGQFDEGILEICLHLVRKSFGFDVDKRMSDPVKIARALSYVINDGVLHGRWDGEYEDGARPTSWSGSVKILQKYDETGKWVKYGQCWVFSAITTTVCRALGMPCRSVTNFVSAHDTDVSITMDTVYELDSNGIPKPTPRRAESTWNFHVWNEVWMKRPQLKKHFSGWQALDSTPQEESEGKFQCGPCPVAAILSGDVTVPYDAPFIFAEVNADVIEWLRSPDDPDELYVMDVNKDKVGNKISTKTPTGEPYNGSISVYGDDKERLDLTNCYKPKEKTEKEREVVSKAVASASLQVPDYESNTRVQVSMDEDKDRVGVGEPFTYSAWVTNSHEKESRTVEVTLVLRGRHYTGTQGQLVKFNRSTAVPLEPKAKKEFSLHVTPEEYLGKLPEGFAMEVQVFVLVKEDRAYVSKSDDFRLRRPDLEISGPRSVKRKEEFKVKVKLTNPLPVPLTQCRLSFEGGIVALDGQSDIDCGTIKARSPWERTLDLKVKASRSILRTISLSFDSKELPDIVGSYRVFMSD